jgi:hypothetical protein
VLVVITAGTAVGGIVGALIAVPLTAAAWGVVQVWDGDELAARWARPKARRPGGGAGPETGACAQPADAQPAPSPAPSG